MQIAIKHEGTMLANDPDYDEWGNDGVRLILRCQHDNLVIEPPCCTGTDCDCQGRHTLYCPDCENRDLTDDPDFLESWFYRGDER